MFYPSPANTEAPGKPRRQILFIAGVLVLIVTVIIGVPYLGTDGWPFGAMVIIAGTFVAVFLWLRFNKRG